MKKAFSKFWKSSKQPRKQRKYLVNSPLHIRKNYLKINLSKDLRKNNGKRNITVVKGDTVKVLRGKFKGKKGKVLKVDYSDCRLTMENVQIKKQDGSKTDVKLRPSNLQIVELNTKDSKRKISQKKETTKKESSKVKDNGVKKNVPKKE